MKSFKFILPMVLAIFFIVGNSSAQDSPNKKGDVYMIVDEMPEYPGGQDALRSFISENITYPEDAKKAGIVGKVFVTFVVDIDGGVINTKIARGVDPSLDKEAIRVINSLPKWQPGKQKGEAVKVSYTVPIQFALQ